MSGLKVRVFVVVTVTCQSSKHGRKEGLGGQGLGEHSILPEEDSRMKAMTLIEMMVNLSYST